MTSRFCTTNGWLSSRTSQKPSRGTIKIAARSGSRTSQLRSRLRRKMATSVQVRDGKRLVTDGPFAETREQLGGYFLIDAKDLDEAIGIAARIPMVRKGTVEVRPVIEIAGLPD